MGGDNLGINPAGLPDIVGSLTTNGDGGISGWAGNASRYPIIQSGALFATMGGNIHNGSVGYSGNAVNGIKFAANKSNSIYGASNTVQPPSISLIPQIKY